MGLTVIPGQCPPRRHGDVHRDSSGQPGLTRRTPDLPAPGTGVSQQRSQLNGHTTRDIRRSGCFASSFPRKPPSRIVERSVRVRTAVDTCSSCARNRRSARPPSPSQDQLAIFDTVLRQICQCRSIQSMTPSIRRVGCRSPLWPRAHSAGFGGHGSRARAGFVQVLRPAACLARVGVRAVTAPAGSTRAVAARPEIRGPRRARYVQLCDTWPWLRRACPQPR